MQTNKTTGNLLRQLRESRKLLLREVAAAIALDTALLSKIERDERMPTKEQITALSKFYKEESNEIVIAWLSDKLVYEVQDEALALKAIQVAEEKIKYNKRKSK